VISWVVFDLHNNLVSFLLFDARAAAREAGVTLIVPHLAIAAAAVCEEDYDAAYKATESSRVLLYEAVLEQKRAGGERAAQALRPVELALAAGWWTLRQLAAPHFVMRTPARDRAASWDDPESYAAFNRYEAFARARLSGQR
jgi:hypothetical protein